jgi:hypothetical protein
MMVTYIKLPLAFFLVVQGVSKSNSEWLFIRVPGKRVGRDGMPPLVVGIWLVKKGIICPNKKDVSR